MRAWRIGAIAVMGGVLPGCGALLDLDIHYVNDEGGIVGDGQVPDSAAIDGSVPDGADLDGTGPDAGDTTPADLDAEAGPGVDTDVSIPDPGDAAPDVSALDAGHVIPAFVQGTASQNTRTTKTLSLAFDTDVTDHDTIIVAVDFGFAGGALTVSDSIGNPFQPAVAPINNGGTYSSIFYATDIVGGTDTVTVSTSVNNGLFELYIHEYSGIAALDVSAGQVGTPPTPALMESGFATTHAPNDLIFGFGVTGGANPGAGFTLRSAFNSNVTEDQIAATPGPHEATETTAPNAGWAMLMAAFLAR
jgi:hypothetical protein